MPELFATHTCWEQFERLALDIAGGTEGQKQQGKMN
jgi:hypothetical protein